jgi:hypothetical protein
MPRFLRVLLHMTSATQAEDVMRRYCVTNDPGQESMPKIESGLWPHPISLTPLLHAGRGACAHCPSGGPDSGQRGPDARQTSTDAGLLFDLDSDGADSGTRREKMLMYLLIAALALVIALFTGAFIAALRIDPCALETRDWSMIDPDCSRMQTATAFRAIGRSRTATVTRLPSPEPGGAMPSFVDFIAPLAHPGRR